MIIQKLTIHHIASIEDAVIDFEAQPLAESEVFLITGKTGAGKSTILDAICLALYANTPRLDNTKMQGETIDANKEVKINDPRQLMRRNTTEAHVILTFKGSNGIHYEATWAVARSHKKISGSIKSKSWQLKNLDTGITLTKDIEIRNEIKAAVGLDFKQFCRTTLLAQGEFTRFLNSKDDDKAEILEKITGVDIYSKIGVKVYELTGQKREAWEEAKQIVEGTRTLTEEEIEERKKQLTELDNQQKAIKATHEKECAKRDWISGETTLAKAVTESTERLRQASEMVESELFKTKEGIVREWHATTSARLWMKNANSANQTQKEQKEILDGLRIQFTTLLSGQKYAEKEAIKIREEILTIDHYLEEEKERSAVYKNAQTIVSLLTAIHQGRQSIAKENTEMEKEKSTLKETVTPAYQSAMVQAQAAKEALAHAEAKVKRAEDEVATLHLPALRLQHDAAKERLILIHSAKERIESLATIKLQRDTTRQKLAERLDAIHEKQKRWEGLTAPLHDAALKMNVRKEDLDRQKDTIDKFASTLRTKLHIGDTCPICRQQITHDLPHEEELAALVHGLQKAYDEAEKSYQELVQIQTKLQAEIQTETTAYQRDLKTFNEDHSANLAEEKAKEACLACGMEQLHTTTLSSLHVLESSTNTLKEQLAEKIKAGEIREEAVKGLRQALDAKRKQVESLVEYVRKAEKAVNDSKSRIDTACRLIEEKRNVVLKAEQKVCELLVGSWPIDWHLSPDAFAEHLTQAANRYEANVQERQTLVAKENQATTYLQHVATVIHAILEAMPHWKEIESTHASLIENLLEQANKIHQRVTVTLTQLKLAEEHYQTNHAQLSTFLAENNTLTIDRLNLLDSYTSNDIVRIDGELKQYRDDVVAKKTLLNSAQKALAEHQQKRPELTEDETLETLMERIEGYTRQLEEMGEQKGSINQELRTDAENKEKLGAFIKEADEKQAVYQKWSRLNQLIGDATGSKFRKIAQSYVLTSLIHSANSYMKTLSDRYTLKVTPGTFVISLEDAYQGFVSRAASTISGGESFLVSLSLALALSDIGQQWQVNTLFIDEGFGTLSGEPLQKAIETLRSLHSKTGRHVGIISHVEELQERIPVQIQVNQEGNNSSSKITIIPSSPDHVSSNE